MGAWSETKIMGGSDFLKIESGNPQDIRILSEKPTSRVVHGFGKAEMACTGEDCPTCAIFGEDGKQENPPVQRFRAEVYNHTVGKKMIWNFTSGIAKQLKKLDESLTEDGTNLTAVDLKVEAEGTGLKKRYTVTARRTAKPLPAGIEIPF